MFHIYTGVTQILSLYLCIIIISNSSEDSHISAQFSQSTGLVCTFSAGNFYHWTAQNCFTCTWRMVYTNINVNIQASDN